MNAIALVILALAAFGAGSLLHMSVDTLRVLRDTRKATPPAVEYRLAPAEHPVGTRVLIVDGCLDEWRGRVGTVVAIRFTLWALGDDETKKEYLYGYQLDIAPDTWWTAGCLSPIEHQPAGKTFGDLMAEAREGKHVQGA